MNAPNNTWEKSVLTMVNVKSIPSWAHRSSSNSCNLNQKCKIYWLIYLTFNVIQFINWNKYRVSNNTKIPLKMKSDRVREGDKNSRLAYVKHGKSDFCHNFILKFDKPFSWKLIIEFSYPGAHIFCFIRIKSRSCDQSQMNWQKTTRIWVDHILINPAAYSNAA